MVLTETAAWVWPVAGCCPDGQERRAASLHDSRGVLAWAQRGPRSLRARSGVAELVLLHRLRAGVSAGMPAEAARVIALTANAWLGGASAGKP